MRGKHSPNLSSLTLAAGLELKFLVCINVLYVLVPVLVHVLLDGSGHDSAEIDGTVERHATSAPSKQPVPAPRLSTTKPSTKPEFHLELSDASRTHKTIEQSSKPTQEMQSPSKSSPKNKIPFKIESHAPKSSDDPESVPIKFSEDHAIYPQTVSQTVKYVTKDRELIKETIEEEKKIPSSDAIQIVKTDNLTEICSRTEIMPSVEQIRTTTVTNDSSIDPTKLKELLETGGIVEMVRTVTLTSENDTLQPVTREEVVKRINQVVHTLPSEIFDFGDSSTTTIRSGRSESDGVAPMVQHVMSETSDIEKTERVMRTMTSSGGSGYGDVESALRSLPEQLTRSEIEETVSWTAANEQWEVQYSQDTSPGSGNGGGVDTFVSNNNNNNNKNDGSSRHDMHSDTDSDGSPQPRRRSPSKRRTLGSSSGSDVALHEGAELSPLEDDQETHDVVRSICSGNTIEPKTRMKTPGRTSCACWTSIAVAVLVLLIALILALEPQMFRRVIYTLSNNVPRQAGITTTTRTETRTMSSTGTSGTDDLRESMQKIMDTFMSEERKDH
ncbi:hypothetical protein ALC62_04202 [Cyphomyrmex costatus]|uniref:Uncharacterized protein n=1 Tax=Cyphomyrmex costatus TaxID=456900 RepID=A0A195CVV7_9HYME|nr:hypothetical protein ALC62_04202 [Cyphomyrmex costatus]